MPAFSNGIKSAAGKDDKKPAAGGAMSAAMNAAKNAAAGAAAGAAANAPKAAPAAPTAPSAPASGLKSVEEIAKEVIRGSWGVGQDRINKLTAAGYDAKAVQDMVNKLMKK